MPCSRQDFDTPSRICVPLSVQSTEIVRPASGELDLVPNCQDELADDDDVKEKQHVIPSRSTKTMATMTEYTSSGSSSSYSSSIVSLSSATSTSSGDEPDNDNLGAQGFCKTVHSAVPRPSRATNGLREVDDWMPYEGSSTPAPRRVAVEEKGKTPERIQEIPIFPSSRCTNATSWSKSTDDATDDAIGEQRYPGLDNQTSEFQETGDPSTYFLESSSTSSDGEDDGFADLSASVATIRPHESSSSSVVDDVSVSVSRATSPHSDQSYTLEVRPPSSIMATPDDEDQDTYDDSSTIPQTNSPQSRSTPSTASSPGLHSFRRQVTVRVSSPPELPPVPPVASIRARRLRPPSLDGSQFSGPSLRPSSLPDRRSAEYPRANHTSMSTARSPSLSPLAWEITPVASGPTSSTSILASATLAPVDYSTGSRPSEIPNTSPSNSLWSTPSTFRPVPTPTLREVENHTYPQVGRTQFHSTVSSPDSHGSVPVTGLSNSPSNPPSAPQRSTRFTVPLPPSPGPSLRTSAFNSPFPSGTSAADSWGTPATTPGESVYNQTTSIPGEAAQWSELPHPSHPARNSTSTWFPESSANGHNLLWTSVDWHAWSDPTQIPQVPPIPTTTPSPPYITPPGYLLICSYCGSPAPACVCRRYVRVAPVSTGATSGGLRTPIRPPTTPHPTFWFADGTIMFDVDDVFFKVHKYFFERHSEQFRISLARRSAASANIVPVRIPDVKRLDFERLLKVFYPTNLASSDLATVEEWTSVLTLAVKWHMDELISLSIQELTPITSAVDKISLAKKFGLFGYNLAPNSNYNRDWLLPALRELCGRNFPLRFEEARKLDMWTVIKVWEVQHEISVAGLSHNASQIERLIKRRFGLE